jgi:hypothetical protein
MSYDDADLVRNLYIGEKIVSLPIRYSLQEKRNASELIIAPRRLALPRFCRGQDVVSVFSQDSSKRLKT